jgi:hypothetical protein
MLTDALPVSGTSGTAILIPSHEQPAESGPGARRKEACGALASSRIFLTLSAQGAAIDSAGVVEAALSCRLEGAHQTRQARLDGGRFRVKGPKVYDDQDPGRQMRRDLSGHAFYKPPDLRQMVRHLIQRAV